MTAEGSLAWKGRAESRLQVKGPGNVLGCRFEGFQPQVLLATYEPCWPQRVCIQ